MPALDLALGLRMERRSADVLDVLLVQPIGKIARDIRRAVVRQEPWPVNHPSRPDRVWNRIPEALGNQIVDLALDQPELSPRELAVRFMDEEKYFV